MPPLTAILSGFGATLAGLVIQRAAAFTAAGEIETFDVAFYHSAMSYTTLGYGDLVTSEHGRTARTTGKR